MSVKSRQSIFYFFCQSGTRGLSITPVSGQTAPSHELPQTHLQKIRHEIVWLLHHRGHLHLPPPPPPLPPTFIAFLSAVCRGSMSVGQLHPAGRLSLSLFFASFSYSCQLVSTGTWAQTSEALSLTMTPVLRAVCFKVPL